MLQVYTICKEYLLKVREKSDGMLVLGVLSKLYLVIHSTHFVVFYTLNSLSYEK